MRTVSIFTNRNNQAIRLPKDMEFVGVKELEIIKDGDRLILQPIRPSWLTLADSDKTDKDFMQGRETIVPDHR